MAVEFFLWKGYETFALVVVQGEHAHVAQVDDRLFGNLSRDVCQFHVAGERDATMLGKIV